MIVNWTGAPLDDASGCVQLLVDANGQATFGPCDKVGQQGSLSETHQRELDELQRQVAPFDAETATGTLTFNGFGTNESAAWQRAIDAWVQVIYSELASGRVSASGPTVISWVTGTDTTQPRVCNQLNVLVYGYVYANQVPCAGGDVLAATGGWLNDAQLAQFDHWLSDLAPITVANNYLAGTGNATANAADQRAITAWAQLVYGEVSSGRASAAGATALSWFIANPNGIGELCQHLTVLSFGYAYAEILPCAGGVTVQSTGGSLTSAELTEFDGWLYERAALYVENNYLAGTGTTSVSAAESSAIDAWAAALYDRLTANEVKAGDDFDLTTWQGFTADSGFVIYYPPTLYTVSVREGDANSPFSGPIVLTPTTALNERMPQAQSYTLSILAHGATKAYSLYDPVPLLAHGQYLSYQPALLAGHLITPFRLADAPAVRVDDVAAGPAGITTQITAIRADLVYELVVEPAEVVSSGNAAADQTNLDLVEQMIITLRFVR